MSPPDHPITLPLGPPSSPSRRELTIPPNTLASMNFYALHLLPTLWGPDADQYKPGRWVEKVNTTDAGAKAATSPQYGTTSLLGERLKAEPSPIKNPTNSVSQNGAIYMPWYHGPRVCPGKKFSQVEYVAVMTTLISQYRLEPVGDLMSVVGDCRFNITPTFNRPKDAGVRIVPRYFKSSQAR